MKAYAFIFALTFALIGSGLSIFGVCHLRKALPSLRWPREDGTITQSRVVNWYDIDGDVMYGAQIEYRYLVDGVAYTGTRLQMSVTHTSNPARHVRAVARYPKGTVVHVAYDPEHPSTAVLEPGASFGAYLPLSLGLLVTALAGGMLYSLLTSAWTVGVW